MEKLLDWGELIVCFTARNIFRFASIDQKNLKSIAFENTINTTQKKLYQQDIGKNDMCVDPHDLDDENGRQKQRTADAEL